MLNNAIQFTVAGGRAALKIERDGEVAVVRVEDSGMGIAPGFRPYVFDEFRQADSGDGRGGLGLGLAISRQIVELHRGRIVAESPGLGHRATSTGRIPAAD